MQHHRLAADTATFLAAMLALLLQWADVVTPLATMLVAVLSAAWWLMKWGEKLTGKRAHRLRGDDDGE